jgi:hypothetical protein
MLNVKSLFTLLLSPQVGMTYPISQWVDTLFVLREAKLLATLYHSAKRDGCLFDYPEYVQKHLFSAQVYASCQAQQIRFEAAELSHLFEQIGVTALFLKGAAYTLRDSVNSHGRICSDLDVLINQADIPIAEEHLRLNRWKSEVLDDYDEKYYREWAHEIPPLVHLNRGTVIDLHHNLYLPISGRTVAVNEFMSTKQKTQSGCFVLDPSATVMHSIIHMFANEDSSSWMRDLIDITFLIKEFEGQIFWQKLLDLVQKTDFEFEFVCCLHALLYYTDINLPKNVQAFLLAFPFSRGQKWLLKHTILPAISPEHDLILTTRIRFAKKIVYLRGHWIKMPPLVLLKHFAIKSFLAARDQIMGKHHFDPQLPKNPQW